MLNECQSDVSDKAIDFYHNSSEQVFQIEGEAGTGKSYVISDIVRRLRLRPEDILPMAYTGQAAVVMRMKGLPNSRTIDSSIYTPELRPKISGTGVFMNTTFNAPQLTLDFIPKVIKGKKLMIIDEGYTVPLHKKKDIEKYGIKIIVAGDSGQLPPVGDQPAYLVSGKIHRLTQLMRQAEDSGIVYIAQRARYGLPISTGRYGNVLVIDYDDFTDEMITLSNIVLCGKNSTRDYLNGHVRKEILNIDSNIPTYGERVICRKNNFNLELDGIGLANGLTGTVCNMPGVSGFDGRTFTMDFLPDLLSSPFRNLSCDYEYYSASSAEKNMIKNSKYSRGEKFDLAYAITTHLSQGAEYPVGVYVEEYMRGDIQKNINYTAVTRFRDFLIYVKPKRKFF